jgi:hypothetical protein
MEGKREFQKILWFATVDSIGMFFETFLLKISDSFEFLLFLFNQHTEHVKFQKSTSNNGTALQMN